VLPVIVLLGLRDPDAGKSVLIEGRVVVGMGLLG
jgi:hypothetical protein